MRIGIVLSQPPGYSETFFRSKIKGLQENGVEVRLFCQNTNEEFTLCPVVVSPRVSKNPFLQLWFFIKEFVLLLPYVSTVIRYVKLERSEGTAWLQIFKKVYLNAHLLKAKLDWLHFGFATLALGSETVAKELNLENQIEFIGKVADVRPLIEEADVYVIPTLDEGRKEGMPMALVEAMCMAVPVLGSNISGINYVLKNFNRLLFPASDSEELKERLIELKDMSSKERESLGSTLRAYCIQNFSMDGFISEHEKLYKSLL